MLSIPIFKRAQEDLDFIRSDVICIVEISEHAIKTYSM